MVKRLIIGGIWQVLWGKKGHGNVGKQLEKSGVNVSGEEQPVGERVKRTKGNMKLKI